MIARGAPDCLHAFRRPRYPPRSPRSPPPVTGLDALAMPCSWAARPSSASPDSDDRTERLWRTRGGTSGLAPGPSANRERSARRPGCHAGRGCVPNADGHGCQVSALHQECVDVPRCELLDEGRTKGCQRVEWVAIGVPQGEPAPRMSRVSLEVASSQVSPISFDPRWMVRIMSPRRSGAESGCHGSLSRQTGQRACMRPLWVTTVAPVAPHGSYRISLNGYASRLAAYRNPMAPLTVARSPASRRHRRRTTRRRSARRSNVSFATPSRTNAQNGSTGWSSGVHGGRKWSRTFGPPGRATGVPPLEDGPDGHIG